LMGYIGAQLATAAASAGSASRRASKENGWKMYPCPR